MGATMEPPKREKVWLSFDGTLERKGRHAILRPRADPRCFNVFQSDEVRAVGNYVQVLKGAKVLETHIVEGSVFAASGGTTHPDCGGATRCFGGLEECCINGEVVGDCAGEWGC